VVLQRMNCYMMVVRTCWIVGVAELTVAECMKLCFPRHQDDTYYSDSFVHFCHKKVDNLQRQRQKMRDF